MLKVNFPRLQHQQIHKTIFRTKKNDTNGKGL